MLSPCGHLFSNSENLFSSSAREESSLDCALAQILHHNTVRIREKRKHHRNKIPVVGAQLFVPVHQILTGINLAGDPETIDLFLVHLPEILVFDREKDKATIVRF